MRTSAGLLLLGNNPSEFATSEELVRSSGLLAAALSEVGTDHRLADSERLAAMLKKVHGKRIRARMMPMATPAIPWFRELYDDILQYRRHSLFYDVLNPWIEKAQFALAELSRFRTCSPYDCTDESAQDAMWNLYALSRVNDLLLMSFQPGEAASKIPTLTLDEYDAFFSRIGFTVVASDHFSPFHHEIVKVQQSSDDHEPIGVLERRWPGLMLGEMLFSRSGVEVIGGRKHVVKEIAEQSTLYFSYRRQHRTTNDLSMGWGSNSQWRTSFRRDYHSHGIWVYNADRENLLNVDTTSEEDRDGLTHEERVELCKNRCFIVTSKQDQDLWPFDDRLEEPTYS
jgi:hypothetical protein